jgi:hypothetical protein
MFRATVTVALVSGACVALSPGTCIAQQNPVVRVLKDFVVSMLSGVAAQYIADRIPKPEQQIVRSGLLGVNPPRFVWPTSPTPSARQITEVSKYTFNLAWEVPNDGAYSGTLRMVGAYGSLRVRTPDGYTIDQDMEAVRFRHDIWLLASNPRFAPGTAYKEDYGYAPDHFHLVKEFGGDWTVEETCYYDGQTKCNRVQIRRAMPF